jgi:hypothetical protein
MPLHPSITHDILLAAIKRQMFGTENPGFCIDCGAYHDSCEPDAREYRCSQCGKLAVYGAEEILFLLNA